MMPATIANKIPKVTSLKNLANTTYPNKAPAGSETPDKNEYQKAFLRLPVA